MEVFCGYCALLFCCAASWCGKILPSHVLTYLAHTTNLIQGYNKLPPAEGTTLDAVDPETALNTTTSNNSNNTKTGAGGDSVYRYRYSSIIKSEVRGSDVVKCSPVKGTGGSGSGGVNGGVNGGGSSGVNGGVSSTNTSATGSVGIVSGGGFVGGVTSSANGKKFFSHAPKPHVQRAVELTPSSTSCNNAV